MATGHVSGLCGQGIPQKIQNVTVLRGIDIGSGHYIIKIIINLTPPRSITKKNMANQPIKNT